MIIEHGTLQLHSGDSLLECVYKIAQQLGEEIILDRGYDDYNLLADRIAEDNGFLGIEDPAIMNLSTLDDDHTIAAKLALPDWMDPYLIEYFDSTLDSLASLCTYPVEQ
jgi:hypothetical protein